MGLLDVPSVHAPRVSSTFCGRLPGNTTMRSSGDTNVKRMFVGYTTATTLPVSAYDSYTPQSFSGFASGRGDGHLHAGRVRRIEPNRDDELAAAHRVVEPNRARVQRIREQCAYEHDRRQGQQVAHARHHGMACAMLALMLSLAVASSQPDAGELALGVRRLGVVGSVLYVAAHPDDENTRLLAWLASGRGVRAALPLDDARRRRPEPDRRRAGRRCSASSAPRSCSRRGASTAREQCFTRARDFGYSKSADETLRIWGRDEVLADVVLGDPPLPARRDHHPLRRREPRTTATTPPRRCSPRRRSRPPPIPTRFPEQLARGVDAVAGDAAAVQRLDVAPDAPNADLLDALELDVGGYNPLLGRSYGEIAAQSRSQHKSQGFGVAAERGPAPRVLQPRARGGAAAERATCSRASTLGWGAFRAPGGRRAGHRRGARRASTRDDPARALAALLRAHARSSDARRCRARRARGQSAQAARVERG